MDPGSLLLGLALLLVVAFVAVRPLLEQHGPNDEPATRAEQLLGMLALEKPWIRQFAVFPEHQRHGVGTALLRKARECSPVELRLFTFQRNASARAFYEKHGFAAVAFSLSPAPELEPDVEYRWLA